MRNTDQCEQGLLYKSFSIVLLQTFTALKIEVPNNPFIRNEVDGLIDDQLFTHNREIIKRYELKGFDIKIVVDDPSKNVLWGHVHVWAAVFFDNTAQISYRLVVHENGKINDTEFCQTSAPFDTDQIISVAGIVQHVEHWIYDRENGRQEIGRTLKSVTIDHFHLNGDSQYCDEPVQDSGLTFEEVQKRYRGFFDRGLSDFIYHDHHYILIDLWEDIDHQGAVHFDQMDEDEIIEHIELHHKAELVGLMSLYPQEWPYRMADSYPEICGANIAIDTDDLVLANENMCVIIGTYGKRGEEAPTDWVEHLGRRDKYHVSWPEYMILLEIVLAKKQTINYVLNKYIYNSHKGISDNIHDMIEQNALLSVKLSNIITQLDSVRYLRYMSHKHMYLQTSRNLKVDEDERQLNEAIKKVDKSLNNANNMMEIKQANDTKYILLFISIASLFGVLLQNDKVPVFLRISEKFSEQTAIVLIVITSIGIAYGAIILVKMACGYLRKIIKQRKFRNL